MVKKLLKYEFTAMLRRMMPLCLIVLGTALLNRVIQFFERDNSTYQILFWSSVVLLFISCIVLILGTVWISVNRYYRNLFTGEGYLTLSLPVTPDQHLFAKLFTAAVTVVISGAVCVLAVMIITSGPMLVELFKAGGYLYRMAAEEIGGGQMFLYVLEMCLLTLLSICKGLLVLYACVSLGQLGRRNKNRPAKAVGIFFIYYFAVQLLTTAAMIVFAILSANGMLSEILQWISLHARQTAHLVAWGGILWAAAFGTLYYFISRHVLKDRLNLE